MNDIPVDQLEEEVAVLAKQIAALTGRYLVLLAELHRRAHWVEGGYTSLEHWLEWRAGLSIGTARDHVRMALALDKLPMTRESLAKGEISFSKARAIARVGRPETEPELVELARHTTASQLERIIAGVRRADTAGERDGREKIEAVRGVELRFEEDGTLIIRGRLAPEEGAVFLRALEDARRSVRGTHDDQPAAKERTDALVLMAERSLSADGRGTAADRTQVVVHVDAAVLANPASADGRCEIAGQAGTLSAETARRLACDAGVVTMSHGADGQVQQAGRKTRVPSAALRRALAHRDGGRCVFPACGRKIVDAHHARHWSEGGPTVLGNCVSLCKVHHVLVHEGGWSVELTPDGAIFRRPDGSPMPAVPEPPALRSFTDESPAAGYSPDADHRFVLGDFVRHLFSD